MIESFEFEQPAKPLTAMSLDELETIRSTWFKQAKNLLKQIVIHVYGVQKFYSVHNHFDHYTVTDEDALLVQCIRQRSVYVHNASAYDNSCYQDSVYLHIEMADETVVNLFCKGSINNNGSFKFIEFTLNDNNNWFVRPHLDWQNSLVALIARFTTNQAKQKAAAEQKAKNQMLSLLTSGK